MYVDWAKNNLGTRVDIVLENLEGAVFEHYLRLNFPATNNEAKYKDFTVGLTYASKLMVPELHVFNDLKLAVIRSPK